MRLVIGWDRAVARWVGDRLDIADFGPCTAIGIVDNDALIAGVVYNQYRLPNIEMTIASIAPKWCSRSILKDLFSYPFLQLKCGRVTAATEVGNESVRQFLSRLGFREEGLLRQWFLTGDAVVYGMLREECRWLGDRNVANPQART